MSEWSHFTTKEALERAIEKLQIYREHSDGNYKDGMEHVMLIGLLTEKMEQMK
jgi:hypothetical protein